MKTVINIEAKGQRLEFFTRMLYSFQVLIVGITIPVLFFLGISTRQDQKKAKETEIGISAKNSGLTAGSTAYLFGNKI
ncbi:MAG: hypothetical protein ABJA90_02935 [Ginsengibacter sp.]